MGTKPGGIDPNGCFESGQGGKISLKAGPKDAWPMEGGKSPQLIYGQGEGWNTFYGVME